MVRSQNIKVLVVDDHAVVVSGCRAMLESDDQRVYGADDAKSGLKSYLKIKPDVVLLDINLPDLSGFELLRRILKADPDALVIMFSMNTDPSVAVRSIELGAKGFLAKNGDPRELAAVGRVRPAEGDPGGPRREGVADREPGARRRTVVVDGDRVREVRAGDHRVDGVGLGEAEVGLAVDRRVLGGRVVVRVVVVVAGGDSNRRGVRLGGPGRDGRVGRVGDDEADVAADRQVGYRLIEPLLHGLETGRSLPE